MKLIDFGSNQVFREKFPHCAENILCYLLGANVKQACLESVHIFP